MSIVKDSRSLIFFFLIANFICWKCYDYLIVLNYLNIFKCYEAFLLLK